MSQIKTVTEIIEAYKQAWHKVDGLFIESVQALWEDQILEILLDANGRDIIIKDEEDTLDGQAYEYSGTEDPDFEWEQYFE